MLAAVFHHGDGVDNVSVLRHRRRSGCPVSVARLFQLNAEPGHIYDFQSGVPASVQATAMRQATARRHVLSRWKTLVASWVYVLLGGEHGDTQTCVFCLIET